MAEEDGNNTMANYWKSRYELEKKRADGNLRLAAERAGEIADLQLTVKQLSGYIRILQERMIEIKGDALIAIEQEG